MTEPSSPEDATADGSEPGAAATVGVPDPEAARPESSRRDPVELQRLLQGWLAAQLPDDADLVVENLVAPEANGMSSDTLLFDATRNP
jgi:hypothetical protein